MSPGGHQLQSVLPLEQGLSGSRQETTVRGHCPRGKPKRLRCDNGPEFISQDLETWTDKHDIQLEFIQPGNPQQNAYVERYNRTVRYSWLNQYIFESIVEVQDYATKWLWFYNNERPNKANGGLPPKQMLIAA